MAKILFWIALAAPVYTYLGYPLLLALLRPVFSRPIRKRDVEPTVSVVVPAHDEAVVIADRISNALEADYPADKLEVIVVSDGSTDDTAANARARVAALDAAARVRVIEEPVNRGKTA